MLLSLQNRCLKGLEVYRDLRTELGKNNVRLILSGGDSAGVGVSEAEVMREYIASMDSTVTAPYLESASLNTVENARNCRDVFFRVDSSKESGGSTEGEAHVCHVVTSDFHIPRARCIFKTILSSGGNDGVKVPVDIVCHPSDSGHARSRDRYGKYPVYRPIPDRPNDPNQWHLCERLDFEFNAMDTISQYFAKYENLPEPPSDLVTDAIVELRALRDGLTNK